MMVSAKAAGSKLHPYAIENHGSALSEIPGMHFITSLPNHGQDSIFSVISTS